MAKISSYPTAGNVTLSDRLIGTEVGDDNATKNFTVGDMLSLVNDPNVLTEFVPYTGANDDVDLGIWELSANGISLTGPINIPGVGYGTPGQILISQGWNNPPSWEDPAALLDTYKGSFYDSLTQNLTGGANVAIPVILGQTDVSATNGISVVTDGTHLTRITVANAGVYNVLFSAQLTNSGGSGQTVDFWLRKNGETAAFNVPDSNGKVQLQGNASYLMAAWNYFIALDAGDYIYLMWTATSTNITMINAPANGVHPATPSIIVTLNKV
jgi:hypothetical protein